MRIQEESLMMRFFRRIGKDSLAWSLRRWHVPVSKEGLVLEVGSGGGPYDRANILCDAHLDTYERQYAPLVQDRPMVLAFGEKLPFRDQVFDFVIASHVLEHSAEPEKFISEIQRVGKAGYLEVPDAFLERLAGYRFHRLEITRDDDTLKIRKKRHHIPDREVYDLYKSGYHEVLPELMRKRPFHFFIRYYWFLPEKEIRYEIVNPEYEFDWDLPEDEKGPPKRRFFAKARRRARATLRKVLTQNERNQSLNIFDFLHCPACLCARLDKRQDEVACEQCGKTYPIVVDHIIDFTGNNSKKSMNQTCFSS